MNWISTKKILPEKDVKVLVIIIKSSIKVNGDLPGIATGYLRLIADKLQWQLDLDYSCCCGSLQELKYITHWMPLPQEPE